VKILIGSPNEYKIKDNINVKTPMIPDAKEKYSAGIILNSPVKN